MANVIRNAVAGLMSAALIALSLPVTALADADHQVKEEDLVFSKNYSITCVNSGDYYHYVIDLPTSGKVNFVISKVPKDKDNVKGYAWCEDSNRSRLFTVFGWEEGDWSHTYNLLAGQYDLYLSADGTYHGKNVAYSFCVEYTPSNETKSESQLEKNNSYTTATTYKSGTVKGHLGFNDDKDIYKYKVTKSGYTTITFTPGFGSTYFDFTNSDGDVKYGEYSVQFGKNVYKYFTPKGTYYLTINRGSDEKAGTYNLSMSSSALKSVKIKSLKKYKKGKKRGFIVTFTKNSSCDGYQVCYSLKKNCKSGNKYKNIYSKYAYSEKVTGLKKNKKYYVRVRSFKEFNGKKYYSSWSSIKTVKVK